MMFRTRLLVIFAIAMIAAVGTVELLVQGIARRTFENLEARHAAALALQFQKEFQRRGREIVRAVNAIAASNDATDIAIAGDRARYFDAAPGLAASHGRVREGGAWPRAGAERSLQRAAVAEAI